MNLGFYLSVLNQTHTKIYICYVYYLFYLTSKSIVTHNIIVYEKYNENYQKLLEYRWNIMQVILIVLCIMFKWCYISLSKLRGSVFLLKVEFLSLPPLKNMCEFPPQAQFFSRKVIYATKLTYFTIF